MPIIRYFIIVGAALLAALFVADGLATQPVSPMAQNGGLQASNSDNDRKGSLYFWRAAEAQKIDRVSAANVVLPDHPSLPVTAERLAYEADLFDRMRAPPQRDSLAPLSSPPTVSQTVQLARPVPETPRVKRKVLRRDRTQEEAARSIAIRRPDPFAFFGGTFAQLR